MKRALSIRLKVLIPSVILAIALIGGLHLAIQAVDTQRRHYEAATRLNASLVPTIDEMTAISERAQSDVYQISVLKSLDFPPEEAAVVQSRLEDDLVRVEILFSLVRQEADGLVSIPSTLTARVTEFVQVAKQAASLVSENPTLGVLFARSSAEPFDLLREDLASLRQEASETMMEIQQRVDIDAKRSRTTMLIFGFGMAVAGLIGTGYVVSMWVVRPLLRLANAVRGIQHGELDTPIPSLARADEMGLMAAAIEVLRRGALEKKQVENALAESEQRLRNIVEHSTNLFYTHTPEHQLTYLSPQTREFFDCDPEEAMTLWTEFATDNPLNEIGFANTLRAIETGERQPPYELELVGKTGRRIFVEVNEAPLVKDGKTVAMVGSLTDITERRKAEDDLRRSEGLFRQVFEILPVGLWIADKHGELQQGNPAGVAIWGAEPLVDQEEYGVFKARRLPSREEIAPEDWALAHTVNEGVTISDELLEIDAFDGVTRVVLNYTAPVWNEEGEIEAAIVVNQDVTKRVRAEEARQALEAQFREQQRLEAIGTLASGVAHEINNPLMGMINYADLIQDRVPDEQLKEFASGIVEEGRRIADIIKNLVTFSQQEQLQTRPADPREIIQRAVELVRSLMKRDGIEVLVEMDDELPMVNCRRQQIQQVLVNLLGNAHDSVADRYPNSDERKTVRITSCLRDEPEGAKVRITVEDHGVGIPEDAVGRLFEPFFSTKPRERGSGLGLWASYNIVNEHNGNITVENVEGVYTRFHVDLPIAEPENAAEA